MVLLRSLRVFQKGHTETHGQLLVVHHLAQSLLLLFVRSVNKGVAPRAPLLQGGIVVAQHAINLPTDVCHFIQGAFLGCSVRSGLHGREEATHHGHRKEGLDVLIHVEYTGILVGVKGTIAHHQGIFNITQHLFKVFTGSTIPMGGIFKISNGLGYFGR